MFSYLCRDMQKVINELINNSLKGVDTYRYKDATWLIFSEGYTWVVELMDGGTLWFNYKFFKNLLYYVSLDPNESIEYITGWAESYFLKDSVGWKVFDSTAIHRENKAVSVVQRGVKETKSYDSDRKFLLYDEKYRNGYVNVYDVVGGGIKETKENGDLRLWESRCVKALGIKNTYPDMIPGDYNWQDEFNAEKVIQNGNKLVHE
jgi:hypothetical protein